MNPTPSVAVLPFQDLSPEGDQQYFCEGMADEIINALSSLGGIQVASRTATVRVQERQLDLAAIGQQLNVQHLVEGSVRKAGNRVRITAQLTNAADGYQLWTERYDRDLDDVFAVQDDIARTIAERLRVKLGADAPPLVRKTTSSPEAYSSYLKGRYHWARRNRWQMRAAIEAFEKAASLDPQFALPHAGLADCYTIMAIYGVRSGAELGPLAFAAAERALALDPDQAEVQHAYGAACEWVKDDTVKAEAAYRHALKLNPGLAKTHAYLSLLLSFTGRTRESQGSALEAVRLEPESGIVNYIASGVMYWAGHYAAAERLSRDAIELEPETALPRWVQSLALLQLGRDDEAVATAEHAVDLGDRMPVLLGVLGYIYGRVGRIADTEALLAEAQRRSTTEYFAPYSLASITAGLGRTEETLTLLERAYAERNTQVRCVSVEPIFDDVRQHPRCQALLRQMNLPARNP